MALLLITGAVGLMVLGLPVAFSLGVVSIVYFLINDIPLGAIAQILTTGTDSFLMLAIPFFVAAGSLMNFSGVTERLFRFANLLVGHICGGLGHVNVVASIIFAGMSGSIVADVGGLGQIEIKAMKDRGFPSDFSAAITAASALIGPIIPPSIIFVIYGGLTGASITQLFLAGVIPGLLMGLALMFAVYLIARRNKYPVENRAPLREVLKGFWKAIPPLCTPLIILGGMLVGIFTPTEASVIACLYALILGTVYRELKLRDIPQIAYSVIITSTTIMFLIASAKLFAWILIKEKVGPWTVLALTSISNNPLVIMFMLSLVVLLLGCFLDGTTILIILIPIILPLLNAMNIDLIYFGVFFCIGLTFGSITPPVGMAMFLVIPMAGITMDEYVRAIFPFLIILYIADLLIMFVPPLSLWLPGIFF